MSFKTSLYADANPKALEVFGALPEFAGRRYHFPRDTASITTPEYGLIAVSDLDRFCLDLAEMGSAEHQLELSIEAPPHLGLPDGIWGHFEERGKRYPYHNYPPPRLKALGQLRHLAEKCTARVWLVCDHERGDDPYDYWIWLFLPPTANKEAYEMVFA
jgi:hypothetical protein